MIGRHAADAPTTPMPPVPPAHEADMERWEILWRETNPDAWMEPLRHGGTRVEREMRKTMRERGLLLARRAGRRARRLRAALARGGQA